eukprot:TRINITY_DN20921_c0_g1_i1.p1 TRINITY_DN20921_c0_g1~~TRINITY_DN20921_c0_g1_i1.p1  ORF type:complete len:603 (+),score=148.44 TRINITY_DN20921_c0_g1_i1:37-1845(+)
MWGGGGAHGRVDPGVRDPRRANYHQNGGHLKMMHNEEAFVDEMMHKRQLQQLHKAELEQQIDDVRRRKEQERHQKRAEDEYWEEQWHAQQLKKDRARAEEDRKRQNPNQPAPPPAKDPASVYHPPGRRPLPGAKRVDFASPLGDDPYGQYGQNGQPPPHGAPDAPTVQIRPSRIEAFSFGGGSGGAAPTIGSDLVDVQAVFDANDALGRVLRQGVHGAIGKPPTTSSSEAVVSRMLDTDPSMPADYYLSQFAGVQRLPQPSLNIADNVAGPSPPPHASPKAPHSAAATPFWLQPNLPAVPPVGAAPSPVGGAGLAQDLQLSSKEPMQPLKVQAPRRGRGKVKNTASPTASPEQAPLVAGADLLQQLEGLTYLTPLPPRTKRGAEQGGDNELLGTSTMVAPQVGYKVASAPSGATCDRPTPTGRPATPDYASHPTARADPYPPTTQLAMLCSQPQEASAARPRRRRDGMNIPTGWVTFKGSVFELLTEDDIRSGGEDFVVHLSGDGTLVPNAPEILIRSLSSAHPAFGSHRATMWPPTAWIMSPDRKSCRCILQPTPDFAISTDIDVTVHAAAAALATSAVAVYPKSNPMAFTIRTRDAGGCV